MENRFGSEKISPEAEKMIKGLPQIKEDGSFGEKLSPQGQEMVAKLKETKPKETIAAKTFNTLISYLKRMEDAILKIKFNPNITVDAPKIPQPNVQVDVKPPIVKVTIPEIKVPPAPPSKVTVVAPKPEVIIQPSEELPQEVDYGYDERGNLNEITETYKNKIVTLTIEGNTRRIKTIPR